MLPTYNRAHLLPHAIRSVLAQTYRNIELIVIDDDSKDDTAQVVAAFADPRIRYFRNPENLRLPRGLNKGFSRSRGSYLTWTSDDNLYAEEAIARMVAVLESGTCDFVFANYFHFSDLEEATGKPLNFQPVSLPAVPRLEKGNSVGACFLYNRRVYETIGEYDPELFLVEDYDYFIRIAQRFRIGHIDEPLYFFRRHDEALFCSRYAEVKAADVLVRYKNGLLDKDAATTACADLIMRDLDGLRNGLLRSAYSALGKLSFRLTNIYRDFLRVYVMWRLRGGVLKVLERFGSNVITFRQAKDALRDVLQGIGRVEYKG